VTPGLPLGPHPCNPSCLGHEPKAKVAIDKVLRNYSSSTFYNINIAKISINLKYYDIHCCNLKLKEKLDHILVMGLHTREVPKSIYNLFV
jgi:hypothetical protein